MSKMIGISTACFYPLETEKSLQKLCRRGVQSCEIFYNTYSELTDSFTAQLSAIIRDGGISVTSAHPFLSFAESNELFSSYPRRFTDYLESYKRYFEVMERLNAGVLVIHGGRPVLSIPDEEYYERFGILAETGLAFGVTVAQENVVHYLSESPQFLKNMQTALGQRFAMVLDIKQALRARFSPFAFIKEVGESIVHVHLSDHNDNSDCIPPLTGIFDFEALFRSLDGIGYRGHYTVELYSASYRDEEDVFLSRDRLETLLNNA